MFRYPASVPCDRLPHLPMSAPKSSKTERVIWNMFGVLGMFPKRGLCLKGFVFLMEVNRSHYYLVFLERKVQG